LRLDGGLTPSQPVQGVVDLLRRGIGDAEFVGQVVACQCRGGSQFGAVGTARRATIRATTRWALPRGPGGQQGVQAQFAENTQDGVDVAVGFGVGECGRLCWGVTKVSPLRERRIRSMVGVGRCDRLASVRWRTWTPSR